MWLPVACFAVGVLVGWLLLGGFNSLRASARPADLAPNYLQDYLQLVADSYAQSRNLALAKLRLEGLDSTTVQRDLTELAQQSRQINLTAQADRAQGLATALGGSGAAPTPGAVATAAAVRTPLPPPVAAVVASQDSSFFTRFRAGLAPAGAILGLLVLAGLIFWALRRWRLMGRLRPRRNSGGAAGASAQEPLPPASRRGSLQVNPPSYITLNTPGELRYSADIPNFRQDVRIVDASRRGIGEIGLHVSQIPPPDPTTGAPAGLELSLFDINDRRTRKTILVSAQAAADRTTDDLVYGLPADWNKPAVNVETAAGPITLETAYLRLVAQVADYDFRPGVLYQTFRVFTLNVMVTPNQAGGTPPPPPEEDVEEDDVTGATSVAAPPGTP
ncbi:MAG: hypothetical protein U0822_24930 [Anaerolineae bacterium]